MSAAKIKKGDAVIVRSGKDKGRSGTVLQVMPKDGQVLVSGVNVMTRHRKASQTNPQGGIERREAPMAISKIGIAVDGKPSRVRFETGKDGAKVRVAVKSGEKIDG
jgi:large subunit ribosomal protein L24